MFDPKSTEADLKAGNNFSALYGIVKK